MKKILILGGNSKEFDSIALQVAEFGRRHKSYEFYGVALDEIVCHIAPGKFAMTDTKNSRELKDYDLVMIRGRIRKHIDLVFAISKYLQFNDIPFFNDYSNYPPSSKLAQTIVFYELKLPFIETVYSLDKEIMLRTVVGLLDFPVIVKDTYGSHGHDNYLVESTDELGAIFKNTGNINFVVQTYHPNDCDYRILLATGIEAIQIKRMAKNDSHLNNTSQGGRAELIDNLPQEILNQAEQIAVFLKMSLAGIDVLQDKHTKKYYFLEANAQPQMVTGAFLPEKEVLMEKLLRRLLAN